MQSHPASPALVDSIVQSAAPAATLAGWTKEDKCSICFDELLADSTAVAFPCPAHHIFHRDCIVAWIRQEAHCPLCRTQAPDPGYPAPPSPVAAAAASAVFGATDFNYDSE